ncbi:hypothetical protein EZS27_042622, partial [termite gut metagenome]
MFIDPLLTNYIYRSIRYEITFLIIKNDYPLFHLSCLSSQKKLANIMNLLNFVSQYPDESSCKAKF